MKTYIFLVILDCIRLVISCKHDPNITNELYPSCPNKYFRRKRALNEYTRWIGNQDTTDEFLVKVLDDDLTTSRIKPIVAVNIMPPTQGGDKIIIGAAHVPMLTTLLSTTSEPREYTRFVPPATISGIENQNLAISTMNIPTTTRIPQLQPIQPQGFTSSRIQPLQPQQGYSLRDDSPPASPQFISRTPILVARQYAPIEPVAFNRRTSTGPLTPPLRLNNLRAFTLPTRTIHPAPINPPVRTTKNFRIFQPFEKQTEPGLLSRTTYDIPERTTKTMFEYSTRYADSHEYSTTIDKRTDGARRQEFKKVAEKELSYNTLLYNDEDSISNKKDDQEGGDSEYDKSIAIEDTIPPHSALNVNEINEENETKSETTPTEAKEGITDTNIYDDNNDNMTTVRSSYVEKLSYKRRSYCSLLKLRQLNFNSPRTLPEIISQLKAWAEDSPVVKWMDITRGNLTAMENPIYMMVVDDPSSGQIVSAKQTVMILAGIQGRDHQAVAAAMYVLYQLIERTESHSDLLTKYRFWIIPVFNPDGYDYSMTFSNRREWTKNLRQQWDPCKGRESCTLCESHGIRCIIQPCYGVNLDRNFEYQWIPAEELKSEHPCGSLYAGSRQLSEVETRALTQHLLDHRNHIYTFITFKEGDVLRARASRAASAAYSISNRPYVAGQTSEFLPLYAGGIEDWVDGHLGIDSTYTIMMFRPQDSYKNRPMTERVVHEAYAAMDTLLLQSVEPHENGKVVKLTGHGRGYWSRTLPKLSHIIIAINFLLLLNG